ncbi:1-acyl-sn-glycerol-3-phosphate acyltransferase BAT2, chloroplastic [Ipomoea triloba]|uniref:1-acyl-sn-glycerol-3-phosphate acyltransferase BAT2, chloroplastic n=1 Tax=Ipomoea triloba TaxID=35885 RepID=UPI00125E2770|nr:1-acyl-sn-glycerol-3-phosphate acyltransferase BAT2, chloroplastic [Ipomoea triloba]
MDISFAKLQSKFNNFQFRPSLPPHHCWEKDAKLLVSPFLIPQSNVHYANYCRCSYFKQPIWRISRTNNIALSTRIHSCASWPSSYPEMKFGRMPGDYNMFKHNRLPRYIAVRSELVGTGSAGAAYPLPELQFGSKIRGIGFYAATAFSAFFLFVLMLAAHPFVLCFDRYRRKIHHLVAMVWATLTVSPFYKIEVKGLENLPPDDTPAVFVSNHQSFLDIYTLLTLGRSFKFISKTAIFLFPIIGWAMYLMGTIPLRRMDTRSQLDCLKRCMDLVTKGASVFFFPEGTRSKDGKLGVFKKGAFSIAAKTGVPVIPITLLGTGKIMPAGMEGRLNCGSVKVVIHQPIEGNNPEALCSEARNVISNQLNLQG